MAEEAIMEAGTGMVTLAIEIGIEIVQAEIGIETKQLK